MFLENKYTIIYFSIIERSKSRIINEYTEKHHIVPRCLGGNDDDDNIAVLTGREHFICHRLLTKMVSGRAKFQMDKAALMMLFGHGDGRYKPSSRTIQKLREAAAISTSKMSLGKPKHSDETKRRIGDAHRGKRRGPMSDEQKRIRSETQKGRTSPRKGRKFPDTKRVHSLESREKMSNSHSVREMVSCENCGKTLQRASYSRWHGDACRH